MGWEEYHVHVVTIISLMTISTSFNQPETVPSDSVSHIQQSVEIVSFRRSAKERCTGILDHFHHFDWLNVPFFSFEGFQRR